MKYKVIYCTDASGGGNPDGMVVTSFYTFNQAHLSATAWAGLTGQIYFALLWDGTQWRYYS